MYFQESHPPPHPPKAGKRFLMLWGLINFKHKTIKGEFFIVFGTSYPKINLLPSKDNLYPPIQRLKTLNKTL